MLAPAQLKPLDDILTRTGKSKPVLIGEALPRFARMLKLKPREIVFPIGDLLVIVTVTYGEKFLPADRFVEKTHVKTEVKEK